MVKIHSCDFLLPGKAVRMVPRSNAPANISADTSWVMSPDQRNSTRRQGVNITFILINKRNPLFRHKALTSERVFIHFSQSNRERRVCMWCVRLWLWWRWFCVVIRIRWCETGGKEEAGGGWGSICLLLELSYFLILHHLNCACLNLFPTSPF